MVVLLPSCYTGGRVQVSHDGSTRTFDFAKNSATDICMFAWYDETSYAMDTIASGYQLALIYDIIPTSSAIPRLPVPKNAIPALRDVLQKWSDGHYANHSGLNLVAIVLTHKYDKKGLTLKMLRGEDHHRASHIRNVAEELGYVVGLAKLRYRILGVTDEDCDNFCERCESRGHDGTEMEMSRVRSTCIKIDNMVDLSGSPIRGFAKLKLLKSNLILDNPFENQKPDTALVYENSHSGYAYSDTDCDIGVRNFSDVS